MIYLYIGVVFISKTALKVRSGGSVVECSWAAAVELLQLYSSLLSATDIEMIQTCVSLTVLDDPFGHLSNGPCDFFASSFLWWERWPICDQSNSYTNLTIITPGFNKEKSAMCKAIKLWIFEIKN